jgi:hypothetical protein
LLANVYGYLADYIVLSKRVLLAVSTWVMASYLTDLWDRFPHLLITSPEGGCGKTRLLELLEQVCPNAFQVGGASAAYVYRSIRKAKVEGKLGPTILLDEAQSLNWKNDERSQKLKALFYSSIARNAKQGLCGPAAADYDPEDFPTYCPKVAAHIGKPDRLLADRSILAPMKKMTEEEGATLKRCRARVWEAEGSAIGIELIEWSGNERLKEKVAEIYDDPDFEQFAIGNGRMANLLEPLQAVLLAEEQTEALEVLEAYAKGLDAMGREAESQSDGVKLLAALRDIFESKGEDWEFVSTEDTVIPNLKLREEGWEEYSHGKPITARGIALLLVEYGIRPTRNKSQTCHGYYRHDFEDAWDRYLPPLPDGQAGCGEPSDPSNPSTRSGAATSKKGGAR